MNLPLGGGGRKQCLGFDKIASSISGSGTQFGLFNKGQGDLWGHSHKMEIVLVLLQLYLFLIKRLVLLTFC